jgi:hypothetical protein
MANYPETGLFSKAQRDIRFVGYLDILGFSSKVISDFSSTLALYDQIISLMDVVRNVNLPDLTIRVLSDSILLVSPKPTSVLYAANAVHQGALLCDCLVRGGIAAGNHTEVSKDGNLFMVSEPLVLAAKIEQTISFPCVALHPNASPSMELAREIAVPNLQRVLLFYQGWWIVNPFSIMWGYSAASRVLALKEKYPQSSGKYDWFLGLYQAVMDDKPLIPD